MLAVCSPFEYGWEYDESLTDIEQLKECADRFGWSCLGMKMLDLKKRTNKNKQIRMKRRFLDSGFVPVDIRDGMGDPKKFGNWAVAYVPTSTPEVYRNVIEERLKV